ncbi:MAG: Endonuclease/exonuclease/phosphatase [Francisellaceae bacterium]|nr:Endonuclease/exonuclease/phosphatase [Francisellaceae bacterium]
MRIISANLNGIRSANKKGFFKFILKDNPDVVCIQETKAHLDQLTAPDFYPKGYHYYFCQAQKKGYSGVAIYSKEEPHTVTRGLGWTVADSEGRYIQADFEHYSVASLYLPSGTSGELRQNVKYEFLDKYKKILKKQVDSIKPLIICGDWNIAHKEIDLKNWKSNQDASGFLPKERAWMDELFNEIGFVDAFRVLNKEPDQYTWWSQRSRTAWDNNVGWRIDYQVVTPSLIDKIKSVSIYKEEKFSDHAPLIIEYKL